MESRMLSLFFTFIFATLLAVFGCGGGGGGGGSGDGDTTTDTVTIKDRTIFVNPDDSMLYSYSDDSGEHFTYYGRRDASGLVSVISMVDYVDEDGNTYRISYDNQGMPAKVINEQGTALEFEYNFKALAEVNTEEYRAGSDGLMRIDSIRVTATMLNGDMPSEVQTLVPLDDTVVVDLNQAIVDANLLEPIGNIAINVTKCGEPADPTVPVKVNFRWSVDSPNTWQYPAFPTSQPGRFVSRIPQRRPDTFPETAESLCASFVSALGLACNVFGPPLTSNPAYLTDPAVQSAICAEVAIVVGSSPATPVGGATAGAACLALLRGGTITCAKLSEYSVDPTPDGTDTAQFVLCSPIKETLNAIDAALDIDNTFPVRAVADFSEGNQTYMGASGDDHWVFTSEEKVFSAYGPYDEDLVISAFTPSIDQITTFPSSPNAGQWYTATADLSCVFGLDLSISVTRDGVPLAYEHSFIDGRTFGRIFYWVE